jgi:phage baseplate assembly protein W
VKPFTSIRHPIAIDGGLGRVAVETDYALHVEQMMLQVLLTSPGERINRPDFGCGLRQMVFAPNSDASSNLIKVAVSQALDKWLGTAIKVDTVEVKATDATLQVRVAYILKARQQRRFLNIEVPL